MNDCLALKRARVTMKSRVGVNGLGLGWQKKLPPLACSNLKDFYIGNKK